MSGKPICKLRTLDRSNGCSGNRINCDYGQPVDECLTDSLRSAFRPSGEETHRHRDHGEYARRKQRC